MTVEERLRGALNARAEQVTPDRLAPAAPPGASPSRRTLGPMIAAAAAVAVLTGGVVAGHGLIEAPAAPASPTRPTQPAPTQPAVIVPTLPELGTPAPRLKQKQGTPLPKGKVDTELPPQKPIPGLPWNGVGDGYPSAGSDQIDPDVAKSKEAAVRGAEPFGTLTVTPPQPTGDPADTGP
jgi:hypothetical protein